MKIDANKDYYKILGVQRTASADEIKKAFHLLIRLYHPDVSQNTYDNLNRYYELTEAYEVLGNLDNRLQYSILLNQDLLNEKLMHKKFKIPDYPPRMTSNKRYKKVKVEF